MITENSHGITKSSDLPEFIDRRLRQCDDEMFNPRKNKKPLVLGNRLPDESSIMLQSNDYLNISNHPRIRNAQLEMLSAMHREPLMSAVFLHEDSAMNQFEQRMATFTGFRSSILCQSGWAANVGLLHVIADSTVPVYIDFFAHMSLWDGIKISGATPYPFRHNDPVHLDRLISENGQGIIVLDSLYSTSGEIAPLREIVEVANRNGCVLVVDESHSLGTHGRFGSGLINEYGLTDQVHFITASLAKAFAGRAGIICCPSRVKKFYPFMSSPSIFSTTLLDFEIAGLNATLDVIIEEDERRKDLHEKSKYFRKNLSALGYSVASESQIVSILSGFESDTELLRDALEERNVFGSAFMAPATPRTRSLMRFSIHSGLTIEELDYVLNVCSDIREEVRMHDWKSTKKKRVSL